MSRNLWIALILAAATLVLGTVSFLLQKRAMPVIAEPPDYAQLSAWTFRPAETTAPVWETGWDIDVFLAAPSSARAPATPAKAERLDSAAKADAVSLSNDLSGFGKVYAPVYRADDSASDVRRAFEHYLENDNRGRAFVIALHEPLSIETFAAISGDPLVRDRFGGFMIMVARDRSLGEPDVAIGAGAGSLSAICPDATIISPCIRAVIVKPKRGALSIDSGKSGLIALRDTWLATLESSADQLAAPIGDAEFIAPSEIRSPGDTDDARGNAPD